MRGTWRKKRFGERGRLEREGVSFRERERERDLVEGERGRFERVRERGRFE